MVSTFSDVDDNYAVERSAKSFPARGPSENPFRYGFKHEVLKVSAEGWFNSFVGRRLMINETKQDMRPSYSMYPYFRGPGGKRRNAGLLQSGGDRR